MKSQLKEISTEMRRLEALYDEDTDCDAPYVEDDSEYQSLVSHYQSLQDDFRQTYGDEYDPYKRP